jgi:acyl-CoA synthetase (AMP-forming)/AMP-acid ligase II
MKRLGAAPGDRVAALALNSDVFFRVLFAVPWVGAVIVPLNTRWSVAELSRALENCGAQILFVDENFLNEAASARLACSTTDSFSSLQILHQSTRVTVMTCSAFSTPAAPPATQKG